MLIFEHKSFFLRPAIFEIPQPKWHYIAIFAFKSGNSATKMLCSNASKETAPHETASFMTFRGCLHGLHDSLWTQFPNFVQQLLNGVHSAIFAAHNIFFSCSLALYFGTLFWDDDTIFWDKNLLFSFSFLTEKNLLPLQF